MDLIAAYHEVGTYRGAAVMCGCDHKTVRRAVERHRAGAAARQRPPRGHNYDPLAELVAARVANTKGRISAKRLLPQAKAAGYTGSARNFRRLVARAKATWRRGHHRGRRPAVWAPGDTLVIDWGATGALHAFCAVLAWSRWRFVRFAADERAETTLSLLAEALEAVGGVPKVVLSDRMGCLKGAVVAKVVVPTPDYVRFATHFGFRPDFCEAADPESKGIVENLVGYAKSDLIVPADLHAADLAAANDAARAWCAEVNSRRHSEIAAIPDERLAKEREVLGALPTLRPQLGRVTWRKVDRLSCIRIGSARYSVPTRLIGTSVEVQVADGRVRMVVADEIVADHALVAPGEASVADEHYDRPRASQPRRPVRPQSVAEKAFCALGEPAEAYVKGAAAAGVTNLAAELEELAGMLAAHGPEALSAALTRAVAFSRWRASDVRSILAAGAGVPDPHPAGEALVVDLPKARTRPLADYAVEGP